MTMNGKRLEILFEIGELEDNHCANCELVTHQHMEAYEKNKYCHSICNIGLKMQELGKELQLKEPEPPPPKKVTKAGVIIDLHLKGQTSKEINKITGYNKRTISTAITRYRKKNNLPSVRETKRAEIKDLIRKGNNASDIGRLTGYSSRLIHKMIKEIQENANTNIR